MNVKKAIKKGLRRIIGKNSSPITEKSSPGIKEKLCRKLDIGKKTVAGVADIIYKSKNNDVFFRYDIIVRYLAIEYYHGKNDCGLNLYQKMQKARKGDDYSETSYHKFEKLIESFEENGYDQSSYIILGENFGIIDGSHRIAMAIYYGIRNIPVKILAATRNVDYSIDWFMIHGFSSEEIDIIRNKASEIKEKVQAYFSCVIWAPAVFCAEDIIRDMSIFGNVLSVKRHVYTEEGYQKVVRTIYSIDDIEDWKIDKKLEYMKNGRELVSVDLIIDNPTFRIKDRSGMPISTKVERIKKTLRTRYKDRIEDYFFDIIIHIGDNYQQSDFMRHVLEESKESK